jgi:signal transduction histidine kinase
VPGDVAAHELKSPLTVMLMQLESARRALSMNPAMRSAEERVAKAASSGVHLDRLITQMLDVSRITIAGVHPEPEEVNLSELVAETVAQLCDARSPGGSSISLTCQPGVVGRWDRLLMQQVIGNLGGNAVKYGKGQPVEVKLGTENSTAVLRVIDHGIGIDPEDQRKLFQRFERAATARDFGGFGLGLWITRQIVEASGGTIELQSRSGEGSTFTVRLPVVQELLAR